MRIGKTLNETEVAMIELETVKETVLTYVPLYRPFHGYNDHRKACSITFDKDMKQSLLVLAKHHVQTGVVLHTLDFQSMAWERAATNIDYFGRLSFKVLRF